MVVEAIRKGYRDDETVVVIWKLSNDNEDDKKKVRYY